MVLKGFSLDFVEPKFFNDWTIRSTSGSVLSSHSSRCVSDVFGPSRISDPGGSGSSMPLLCGSSVTSSSSVKSLLSNLIWSAFSRAFTHSLILAHRKILSTPNPCPFRQNAILVTGTNCSGYGVWINKTKHSGLDLMLFNRLRESWRTSPESWHLSRIYNTITVISHTNTHGEHLLRVGT